MSGTVLNGFEEIECTGFLYSFSRLFILLFCEMQETSLENRVPEIYVRLFESKSGFPSLLSRRSSGSFFLILKKGRIFWKLCI